MPNIFATCSSMHAMTGYGCLTRNGEAFISAKPTTFVLRSTGPRPKTVIPRSKSRSQAHPASCGPISRFFRRAGIDSKRPSRESAHTRRRPFFLAAAQRQKNSLRIAGEDLEAGQGNEAGKAVQVAQLLWGWHLPIVTTFRGSGKTESQAFFQVSGEFGRKIHPLDFK